MYVLPNVDLRHPIRLLVANVGASATTPSIRVFRTSGMEAKSAQFQLSPRTGPIPPNGTWASSLTFLEVGVGSEPIDGQVQISFDGENVSVAVQYEYDQLVRTTIRLSAVKV
ncbi:MAG: hypothetical protein HW416_1830 [Chloroflexi bacterium]|nr:hypothetical protein [Chloroflexota bacterium]